MAEGTTQLADPADTASPLYFGDYEVLKSIGKGKFAIVYRAKKIGDEQVVALKRIAVDMMNEKAREKCLKEVRLLQSLDHPNIIRYMDSFITENDLVIVYEWAAAGDLKRQLRKAQERGTGFEERVIWKYFSQICNAMKHMHDKRIMHRDLKPANIFLTLDGTIKVGDLGLSRELSEHTVQAHSKVGTPLYMSPEVLKGEGYDFKSDVWSLGCLLYELAMLKSPFKSEGLNLYSLFQKISNGEYQPLPEHYSEELRTLTYAMISTAPEDRPEISYVCKVAQELRTLTADKASRSRKNSAGSAAAGSASAAASTAAMAAGTDSRPNSGLPARQDSAALDRAEAQTKAREEADRANSAGWKRDADSPERPSRKNFVEPALSLTRQGSFKLEHVNYDDVEADMKDEGKDGDGRLGSGKGQRAAQANSNSSSRASSGRRRGGSASSNPRDMSFDREDEDEDEATVKLGHAEYFGEGPSRGSELRERGVVALGSDAAPARNQVRPEPVIRPDSELPLRREENNDYERSKARGAEVGVRAADQTDALPPRRIDRSEMKSSDNSILEKDREKTQSSVGANPYRRMRAEGSDTAATGTPSVGSLPERSGSRGEGGARHKAGGSRGGSRGGDRLDVVVGAKSATQELRVQGKTLEEHLENSSVAFAVMETVYCKLVALGCPLEDPEVKAEFRSKDWSSRGRLLPMHFACDLQIFPQVAGHDAGYRFLQFRRFVHVARWLCSCIGGAAADAVSRIEPEQEAPVMTAKQILRAAQAACGEAEKLPIEVADISPTSLTPGHGVNVCQLLSFLADAALRSTGFAPQSLQYGAGGTETAGAEEGAFQVAEEDEDELEDEAEVDRSDDLRNAGQLLRENGEASMSFEESATSPRSSSRHVLGASMLQCAIDPALWKAETERVAVKLAAHRSSSAQMGVGAEWADHVEAMRKYTAQHSSGTDVDNINSRQAGSRIGEAAVPKVVGSLERIRGDLTSSLAKVRSLEAMINKLGSVPQSAMLFSSVQTELDMQEKTAAEVRIRISACSAQLSELQDRCEEAAEAVRGRAGGGTGGEDGAGGVVVKLKASLQLIKAEVKEMSTSIALLSNGLLGQRQAQAAVNRQEAHRKTAQRRRKGGAADADMENAFLDD